MTLSLDPTSTLPTDGTSGTLVGRVWRPELGGPSVVVVRADGVFDISRSFATMRDLCESPDPAAGVAGAHADRIGDLAAILANTAEDKRDTKKPWLLAPLDLQAVKAAGVTFAISLLERVIEEQARGVPERAAQAREDVEAALGGSVEKIKPGSPQAAELKKVLQEKGLWSQYLEVGIGPDAEIFTKCQVLASVGTGMSIGVLKSSTWNNPEPEVVVVATSKGKIVGATLGNDVNLRDVEGRSALLLSKAKDNNASTSIGPLIRLFDKTFSLDDVRRTRVRAHREGHRRLRARRVKRCRQDQPRPGRPGRADDRPASPVSRRRGAVPRHDVRAGEGPRRARHGLHASSGRCGDDRGGQARRAHERGDDQRQGAGVEFRRGRPDAQSGEAGIALIFLPLSP